MQNLEIMTVFIFMINVKLQKFNSVIWLPQKHFRWIISVQGVQSTVWGPFSALNIILSGLQSNFKTDINLM